MADITQCSGYDCPDKLICYRYVAVSELYQSYFSEDPREQDGTCMYLWDIELPKDSK